MSLHDELVGTKSQPCKLCAYLFTLSVPEELEWRRELALPVEEIPNVTIARYLNKRGVKIDEASVRRHRRNHA